MLKKMIISLAAGLTLSLAAMPAADACPCKGDKKADCACKGKGANGACECAKGGKGAKGGAEKGK
ncbi:MAG: hypothetical protein IT371_23255 [Deltaproteobacteria bacterium]|nr:hypothetical protein [Deltaproteobacteria bacterium]